MQRFGIIAFLLLVLTACENTTFRSSVPTYPVHVVVDTKKMFVDFLPENTNAYITVNAEGYKENGRFMQALTIEDAYGYAGVLVYVSLNGYVAFDLACPYCAAKGRKVPCEMNGIHAVCPHCGEKYEVGSGYATPQKGISHEALRAYNIMSSDGRLTVTQK